MCSSFNDSSLINVLLNCIELDAMCMKDISNTHIISSYRDVFYHCNAFFMLKKNSNWVHVSSVGARV